MDDIPRQSIATRLQVGNKVGHDRFRLIQELGRGGMGVVWLAQDTHLGEQVALKFLPPEVAADPVSLNDLRRETVRSHRLTHPNIVRIHDFHQQNDGVAFISMEYVDGLTLSGLRLQQAQQVLTWEQLAPLAQQLCATLEYAHGEGVVHRDLKPGNVMVDNRGRVKLADFGIAAVVTDSMSRVSARSSSGGTLVYMSPQQLTGKLPTVADDIYSLGATLYELLTGKPPFFSGDISLQILSVPTQPISERLRDFGLENPVPAQVAALIMACLAKEPEPRPQSARIIAEWINLADRRVPETKPETEAASGMPEADGEEAEAGTGATAWWNLKRTWAAGGVAALLSLGALVWSLLGTRINPPAENLPTQALVSKLPEGLALYYSFDSAPSNGSVPDLSPQLNHGYAGGVQWTAQGQRGGALEFSGRSSFVRVPDSPSLNPESITLAAWIKTMRTAGEWRRIFDKDFSHGYALCLSGDWHFAGTAGKAYWQVASGGRKALSFSDVVVNDGQWHHVAATLDRRRLLLYVDGRLQTLSAAEDLQWDERLPENSLDLMIGCNSTEGDAFIGTIDEPMVFNRALSAAEVERVYKITASRP